jgi:hypothetical protein
MSSDGVVLAMSFRDRMVKLAAAEPQGEWPQADASHGAAPGEADAATAALARRVRLMMLISGLTTVIAIGAVVGVVGYRVYRSGGNNAARATDAIVTLPRGARVVATTVAGDHIVVTLDIGGSTEIRTFDPKTLRETGRVRFATAP